MISCKNSMRVSAGGIPRTDFRLGRMTRLCQLGRSKVLVRVSSIGKSRARGLESQVKFFTTALGIRSQVVHEQNGCQEEEVGGAVCD